MLNIRPKTLSIRLQTLSIRPRHIWCPNKDPKNLARRINEKATYHSGMDKEVLMTLNEKNVLLSVLDPRSHRLRCRRIFHLETDKRTLDRERQRRQWRGGMLCGDGEALWGATRPKERLRGGVAVFGRRRSSAGGLRFQVGLQIDGANRKAC